MHPTLALLLALAGHLESRTVHDSHYQRDRRVTVYTPPGYDPKGQYPLLLVFDGDQHLQQGLPDLLEKLHAEGRAPLSVAVLLDNGRGGARLDDLANRAPFAAFVADELIPWVRKDYAVTRDPRHATVMGSSAGGLAAAYVAFLHPELFGNVLSQSGAFWRGAEASNAPPWEWLTAQVAAAPKKDVRFSLEVGAEENRAVLGGRGPVMLEANRRFAAALRAKGYPVKFEEVPNGQHSPESWTPRLPALLAGAGL